MIEYLTTEYFRQVEPYSLTIRISFLLLCQNVEVYL